MAKSENDHMLGKRIREYQILEIIGRGGMGAVYRARHIFLDKERAIKVVHRSLTESEDFVQRFIREAKVLSEINHPNVVHLYDFGMLDDNTFFMVMELIRGETVIERIQKQTRIDAEEALRIVREAALGLSSAHRMGIIHRDISPDNLILIRDESKKEITKVVDFGIAKPLHEDTGRFTMTNFFIGKPEYSSPEQCGTLEENESLDQRSDVYSLGVTFYQMLTGRLPFIASTPQGYLLKHAHEVPQPPSSYLLPGEIPPTLEAVVMKMLKKRREDRHANLEDFITEVDNISFTEGPTLSSIDKKVLLEKAEHPIDATLRADRLDIFPSFSETTQDVDQVNQSTEPVSAQKNEPTEPFRAQSQQDEVFTSTKPLHLPARKSNQIALTLILIAAVICLFGTGCYLLYRFWQEQRAEKSNQILNAAEERLIRGDVEKAEDLLRQAESRNPEGQEARMNRIRYEIATLRKERLVITAKSHLIKAKEFIGVGKLDEASNELNALKALNLPEFQNEIQAINDQIAEYRKASATQQEAMQLLQEINTALLGGNLELSETKLKQFKARRFKGFESNVELLESKIASSKQQQNLKAGTQILDEAENFLAQQNINSAQERIRRAQALKVPDLEQRIDSLTARLTSLQKQKDAVHAKAQSLLNSARLLIQKGQMSQAQEWLSEARKLGVPEFNSEIETLTRLAKSSTIRTGGAGFEAVENALKRGDWIEAERALKAATRNAPQGSTAIINELNRQILSLRPYIGFGVRRKWEDSDRKRTGLEFGAVVAKVDTGSAAQKAGLKSGDVIVEYNSSVLVSDSQLPWLGAYSKPGTEVVLKVVRNGERMDVRFRVESMLSFQQRS